MAEPGRLTHPVFELYRLAALGLLVVYHFCLVTPAQGPGFLFRAGEAGWMGTELILALAGFLCARSFLGRDRVPGGYRAYLVRRLWRIAPAYFAFLAVYLHTGPWLTDAVGRGWVLTPGLEPWYWTFTANLALASGATSGVALEGLFALSLLVQLFAAFGLLFSRVRNPRILTLVILGAWALALVLRAVLESPFALSHYYFTLTRMDAFLAGLLLALGLAQPRTAAWLRRHRWTLLALALAGLGGAAWVTRGLGLHNGPWMTWLPYPFTALAAGALLLAAEGVSTLPRPLAWAASAARVSYSAYLWKLPVVFLVAAWAPGWLPVGGPWAFAAHLGVTLGAVLAAGGLWYLAVEAPLSRLGARLQKPRA